MGMTIGTQPIPRTISKGKLKARMLEVFREIEQSGDKLIVTDNGKPVLLVQPLAAGGTVTEVFSDVAGRVEYRGDLNEPTSEEWAQA
jgi:antitoxin (DNA-binding transcriptional repressor) of toxin-antitoxin stability system